MKTLRGYSLDHARDDGLAGLTLALLAVPQCMAYALIAGLPPVYGLYAAMMGVIVGSLFSSSEYLIVGPTANVSLVVGSILIAATDAPATTAVIYLTLLVGVFQLGFWALRIGNMARFVSQAVITGFVTGAVLVIMGDQVMYLLGFSGESPYFIRRVYEARKVLVQEGQITVYPLLIGVLTIVSILSLRRVHRHMPAGLVTILIGTVVSYWLNFEERGIEVIGTISASLPAVTLPGPNANMVSELISGALALTLLGSVQAVSIAKSMATNTRSSVDENQELFAQGLSNLMAGLFQGFPVTASFSRSFFNFNVGARSRFSGVFCGLFIVLIVLLAAPLAYYIPVPLLAGLIIVVVGDVLDWNDIKVALMTTQRDQVAFMTTFFSVLLLKLDIAIYAGVVMSLIFYLRRAAQLDLKEYIVDESGELKQIHDPEERIEHQVALIDVNGEAFFGASDKIKQRIQNLVDASDRLKVVVLRMKNAMNLDITGAMVLKEIALTLKDEDMTLMLCGTTPHIRQVLEESGVAQVIGEDKILVAQTSLLESTRQAIERAQAHIESVLEGEESREEESEAPLKHTMEELREEEDKPDEESRQDPILEERLQPEDSPS